MRIPVSPGQSQKRPEGDLSASRWRKSDGELSTAAASGHMD